jgi:FkbM family methyltransferase
MSRAIPEAVDHVIAASLRTLPDCRGKANLALSWKQFRERQGPLDGAWDLRLADGSSVRLPRGSRMTWAVAATGYWDRHIIEFLARYMAPSTITFDIGASLGLWTLPLARAARSCDGFVWCFEPNPENVRWLEANIAANGLGAVADVHAVAVGSRPGTANLGYREHGGGNAALLGADSVDTVEVPVIRIDDLELPRRVSLVKMDVEGFELEVLRGARGLIERDRPTIFGEFSPAWLDIRGEDLAAGLRSLTELDYEVYELREQRSASWRPKDRVLLRRLRPPFQTRCENVLLLPSRRREETFAAADHGA